MKKTLNIIPLLALLLIVSCASNVRTKKYTNNDLNSYNSFAYLPNTAFSAAEFNTASNGSTEESLITMLNTKMISEGYALNKDNPDLLVMLTTSDEIKGNFVDVNNVDRIVSGSANANNPNYATVNSSDYSTYLDSGKDALSNRPYKKGSLIVELFDSKTKELVWLGVADDFIAHISDQTLMSRMINEIFEKFPK